MKNTGLPSVLSLAAFTVPVSAKTIWIVVELIFDDGSSGWGEATLSGAEEAVLAEIGHANTLLAGKNVTSPGEAAALLRMAHASDARLVVIRAVEQAFFDVLARRSGISLAALLGGPERRSVPVYANINRGIPVRTPQGFAARAKDVVAEEGYVAIKIAPFDGLDWSRTDHATATHLLGAGIDRIKAVKDAIGPAASLLVDCHSRLSPVMARTVLREVGDAGLFWLEEPLAEEAFDQHTARSLRSFANDRGIRTGMAMLELAAASGVGVSLHNPVGPVLDRISVQVAAALPSFMILERQVRESPLFDAVRGEGQTLVGGAIPITGEPGFGQAPDRSVLVQCTSDGFSRPASLAGLGGAGGDA